MATPFLIECTGHNDYIDNGIAYLISFIQFGCLSTFYKSKFMVRFYISYAYSCEEQLCKQY